MLRYCWVVLAGACTYNPPSIPSDDDPGDPPPDDPAPDAAASVQRTCGITGTSLCLELEQGIQAFARMDVALDGSGADRDATATDVIASRRDVSPPVADDDAAALGLTSRLVVAKDLAITESFTVAMWIQAAPGTTRRWLFDGNRRMFASLGEDKQIRCGIDFTGFDNDRMRLDSSATIDDGNWHHVACTFDASTLVMSVFVDGASNDCKKLDHKITTRGIGASIGAPQISPRTDEHFVGSIDSVRVFDRALASTEVCDLADRSSCQVNCNTGGNGLEIDLPL